MHTLVAKGFGSRWLQAPCCCCSVCLLPPCDADTANLLLHEIDNNLSASSHSPVLRQNRCHCCCWGVCSSGHKQCIVLQLAYLGMLAHLLAHLTICCCCCWCCQVAYCQVEPTHRFFWQEVAARVGTRSASECFAKIFDAARSPAASAKLPRPKTVVSAAAG
jgi:hypothetical protein